MVKINSKFLKKFIVDEIMTKSDYYTEIKKMHGFDEDNKYYDDDLDEDEIKDRDKTLASFPKLLTEDNWYRISKRKVLSEEYLDDYSNDANFLGEYSLKHFTGSEKIIMREFESKKLEIIHVTIVTDVNDCEIICWSIDVD